MKKEDCTPEEWAAHLEKTRVRLRAWRAANRDEFNAARRAERARNPERRRAVEKEYRDRNRSLMAAKSRERRTGMSDAMFRNLVQLQHDSCAVCLRPFLSGDRRCADHDHGTGHPRGILCIHCNAVEGHAKKVGLSPAELGRRINEYLKDPPAKRHAN